MAEDGVRPRVVVVGDVVLDVDLDGRTDRLCPDAPVPVVDVTAERRSPGGAGLTALLCQASGADVTVVAPVADDEAGEALRTELAVLAGMRLVALGHEGPTRRKMRVRSNAQSLVRVDDGGPGRPRPLDDDLAAQVRAVLADADVVLVSDYGAGVTHDPVLRDLLTAVAATGTVVWDPHPRGGDPVPGTALVTPNLAEAAAALHRLGGSVVADEPDRLAVALRDRWDARAVCVTSGSTGAFVAADGAPVFVLAPAVADGDPCGAGDRFVATAAVALARGGDVAGAVTAAVRQASAWVADGGAEGFRRRASAPASTTSSLAAPRAEDPVARAVGQGGAGDRRADVRARPDLAAVAGEGERVEHLAARLRAGGRRLVATGGCFDIVHAGHVATLQAARRLGDALVVVVNSDESVRRLKGPSRPVVTARDRARVLEAFDCVDAVVVFDEDTPEAVLDRLRPDVWAKGGDYGGAELPEAAVVRRHGGRVVLLPYLGGRSTTSIIERSRTA